METAGFAVHAAWTAAIAVGLIEHGQMGRGGMGGGALGGGATGLAYHRNPGLTQQQLRKVRLLKHLSTVMHHTACVARRWTRDRERTSRESEGMKKEGKTKMKRVH